METVSEAVYRFGPFEVRSSAGELLKNGARVKIQEQPYRLLLVLLEHPGALVTREELRGRLWQENTFVDFDGSLRVAVRKLREALDDDADEPRYIETVPKRGYRFLGSEVRKEELTVPTLQAVVPGAGVDETAPAIAAARTAQPASAGRSFLWLTFAACVLAALAVAVWKLLPGSKKLTATDTIVLADFANRTGDPVFDGTLRQGLAVQLQQSPFLKLTTEERIQQILGLMGRPPETPLTPVVAREVCERAGSAAVVDGSIALIGGQYVIGLRARDCRRDNILSEQQVQASRKDDILGALGQMSNTLRAQIGESLVTLEQHKTPLAEAATSSLEALKAYSTGIQVLSTLGDAAATPFFKRATEIDPQFATAYAQLGLTYGSVGESALAAQSTGKAYALRSRATDRERYFIIASYDLFVTGNLGKANDTLATWAEAYPRDMLPHDLLAGGVLPAFGSYDEERAEAVKAIALDPSFNIGYTLLAFACVSLEQYQEAEETLKQARNLGLKSYFSSVVEYELLFLKGGSTRTDKRMEALEQAATQDDLLLINQAAMLAYAGRMADSKNVSRHAADLALQVSHRETAALYQASEAVWEALAGEAEAARSDAAAALQISNQRDVEYGAGFALALSGDRTRSLSLADDMARRFQEDTFVRFSYVPELRAMNSIRAGNASAAIAMLEPGAAYDLGTQGSSMHVPFGSMYAVYVRGLAYLAAYKGAEAALEFEKIAAHPGLVINDPVGALSALQLARAYAMSGDEKRAEMGYQQFFALWKHADRDLLILQQAQKEYAKLIS